MGETVPSFCSLIFPELLMPRTSGNESLIFRTRIGGLFSWKQQTGVFFDSCERTPNLAVFAREVLILIFFSQRNSKRKCNISAVKVLIRSGHNLNQTRDIPLVSVTICQMWQITPIFPNQEHHPIDSFRTKSYCFCGIAGSLLTHRPLDP